MGRQFLRAPAEYPIRRWRLKHAGSGARVARLSVPCRLGGELPAKPFRHHQHDRRSAKALGGFQICAVTSPKCELRFYSSLRATCLPRAAEFFFGAIATKFPRGDFD